MPGACVFVVHNDVSSGFVNPNGYDIDLTIVVKLAAGPSSMQIMACLPTQILQKTGGAHEVWWTFICHAWRTILCTDTRYRVDDLLGACLRREGCVSNRWIEGMHGRANGARQQRMWGHLDESAGAQRDEAGAMHAAGCVRPHVG